MLDLILSWVAFPVALVAVLAGCGLLVRVLTGAPLPGVVLPGLGFAFATCVAHLTASAEATAELTAPLLIALAAAGVTISWPLGARAGAVLPAATASAAVFLAYGVPILASGEPGFAGYIKLDDTATWMALTDRVLEHGRSLEGLAPSSYEATLAFNLGDGYPIGAFLSLGALSRALGIDVAWTIQPFMAVVAGLLAAAIFALTSGLVAHRWLRALIAFIAAQPALLVGYVNWGGIKEIEAAALIATAAALLPAAVDSRRGALSAVPFALALAALLAVLSFGGVIWLLGLLLAPLPALWRRGPAELWPRVGVVAAVAVVALAPLIAGGKLNPPTSSPLTSATAKGNLLEPLSAWQALGIWPAEDFRLPAELGGLTGALIALAICLALAGTVIAVRRRAWAAALYVLSSAAGGAALVLIGSPWVEGKALATLSPALCFAALLGAALLIESASWRWAGVLAIWALAGGVLASNLLGYRGINLAPRDQLAELERIGEQVAGTGPALMTEYNPYGVRHFLRESDAEGASELRRRQIPLRDGGLVERGAWADTDELALDGLLTYRTLVLRRSPAQSRPPSPYALVSRGRYYDVWQRPAGPPPTGVDHLPLGATTDPSGVLDCAQLLRRARAAGSAGRVLFASRAAPNVVVPGSAFAAPESWSAGSGYLLPDRAGTALAEVRVPVAGPWRVWLGGSVRGRIEIRVDGEPVGSVRHELNNDGLYVEVGSAELAAGAHTLEIEYSGSDVHPGSGGTPFPLGPLVLEREAGSAALGTLSASRAAELCGRRLDWVELLPR